MARSIDEIIALHMGGLALELCKQTKRNEELQDKLKESERAVRDRPEAAQKEKKE